MKHAIGSEPSRLPEREGVQQRLTLLRRAVEDAAYELYRGGLDYRRSEALARDVTALRAEISTCERKLRQEVDA